MSKVFLIDVNKCCGCRNCQIACKDEHCDQAWPPYTAPQPEIGQFWMRVSEKERGQFPVVRVSYLPALCAHCEDAPCAAACSQGAFVRRDDGFLVLDPGLCNGCGECLAACPADAIFFNQDLNIAQKCSGCAHLIDDGWTVPRCVDACPNDALRYGEESEFGELLDQAEPAPGLAGFAPRVFYLNLPKRFAAGAFVDTNADEVVIGAAVELLGSDGSVIAETKTDDFGDFMFDQMEAAAYQIRISHESYEEVLLDIDLSEKDLYVGVIEARI